MKKLDLRIDVSKAVALPGPLEVALSVFLPDPARLDARPIVMAAFPGGGYSRGYFDMHFPGHSGYSEAEHHTAAGFVFIAGDHLGVGDSSLPDFSKLSIEMIAAGNDCAVREVFARLEAGTLSADFPPLRHPVKIGIGQSMGGCITIVMQGRHRTYDAIAPLGYSAIHTVLPQRSEAARRKSMQGHSHHRGENLAQLSVAESSLSIDDFVYPFHWEDVPRDILDADMAGGYPLRKTAPPFGSTTIPTCAVTMMAPGCVAEEAAAITVPVLVGDGERDTCPDPLAEPTAYRRSRDVSVYVVPHMAHMHNFAGTRRRLWDRLVQWSRAVALDAAAPYRLMSGASVKTVLVTGATGAQGGATARRLLADGHRVRFLTRTPDSAAAHALVRAGAEAMHGDYEDADSLQRALQGAAAVFSMQMPGPRERAHGFLLVDQARRAGVGQFVQTSVTGTAQHTQFPRWGSGHWDESYWTSKWDIEEYARRAGFPFCTVLRPAFMMENFIPPKAGFMFPDLRRGEIASALRAQSPIQLIAADDIGGYAAATIAAPERFNRADIDLAAEAPDMAGIAATLAHVLSRPVRLLELTPAQAIARGQHAGWVLSQEWINEVGYRADIAALARWNLPLTGFADWVRAHATQFEFDPLPA